MKYLRYFAAAFACAILLGITAFATDVYIDGEKITYDDTTGYPFAENGKILLPLYPTFAAFGCDGIEHDSAKGAVVITKGGISVSCNTGEKVLYRNGTPIYTDYGLVWRGGPLFVPTDIFSAFDAQVEISGSGVLITRADEDSDRIGVFASSYDESYRGSRFFGVKFEPKNGIYLGCVTYGSLSELQAFSQGLHKDIAAFTVFASLDDDASAHEQELAHAAETGKLVRLVLDVPFDGSADTEALAELAFRLERCGARILLCPASGRLCEYSEEYAANEEAFIETFREISDIFRANAPSVALCWQVCTCDPHRARRYYPGDLYTDYVEITVCAKKEYSISDISQTVFDYGYKKPIILEANFTSLEAYDGDIGDAALELCTYLPMKYPQIKAVFFADAPKDKKNSLRYDEFISSLRLGVSSNVYIENPNTAPSDLPYSFRVGNNVMVPPSEIRLCAGFDGMTEKIEKVVYQINGEEIGRSNGIIPYETQADFSEYAGQTVDLRITAMNRSDVALAQTMYTLTVSSRHSADMTWNGEGTEKGDVHPAVYVVAILISLGAVIFISKKINDIFC